MIIKNGYIMNVRQKGGILMLYENLNQRKKELGLGRKNWDLLQNSFPNCPECRWERSIRS